MSTPFRLDGQAAIITGGSRGLGRAIAEAFLGAGAAVTICGRNPEVGEQAVAEMASANGEDAVAFVACDVTDESAVAGLIATAEQRFGPPRLLVNNAGPTDLLHTRDVDAPAGALTLPNWHRIQDATLTSAFLVIHAALDPMTRVGGGAIVNISSVAAAQAVPGFDGYAMGKAGLEALTRQVGVSYAHLGIRANALRVGAIAVDHSRGAGRPASAPPAAADAHDPDDWRRPQMPPAGQPRDVANAALFLASPAAAYVNAAVLAVDGGMGARSLMPWQTPRPQREEEQWVADQHI